VELAYLLVTNLKIKFGSLYCLYLVYGTQPHQPKVQIPVSIALWAKLQELVTHEGAKPEVKAIYEYLKKERAFYFTVLVEILPPPHFWPVPESRMRPELTTADTLTGILDLDPLEKIASVYQNAKTMSSGNSITAMNFIDPNFVPELNHILITNSRYSIDQQQIEQQRQLQQQKELHLQSQQRRHRQEQRQQLKKLQEEHHHAQIEIQDTPFSTHVTPDAPPIDLGSPPSSPKLESLEEEVAATEVKAQDPESEQQQHLLFNDNSFEFDNYESDGHGDFDEGNDNFLFNATGPDFFPPDSILQDSTDGDIDQSGQEGDAMKKRRASDAPIKSVKRQKK